MIEHVFYIRNIAIMATLLIATNTDLKRRIIPNATVISIFFYGLVDAGYFLLIEKGITPVFKEVIMSKVLGLCIAVLISGMSRLVAKDGLGAGDIKMLLALGFTLGLSTFLQMMSLTAIISCFFTCLLLITRKIDRSSTLPFAPYIALGTCLTFLTDLFSR